LLRRNLGIQADVALDKDLIWALADGEYHSGEALGSMLGISRAAVWKRVGQLVDLGVDVERVRGRGYRIVGGLRLLDASMLGQRLGNKMKVQVLGATGSTNADALAQLAGGGQAPFAVLAEYQSAGRGRRGRRWASPYGSNLYLSLGWRFGVGAPRLEGLSLAVGIAVAESLEATAGLSGKVRLKWPNDVWVDGRKIAGVLIELSGDLEDACAAVVGIGINGRLGDIAAAGIDQPWTDLYRENGKIPDRSLLAADLLERLHHMLETFPDKGFASWRERWLALDGLAGQRVSVTTASGSVSGLGQGVDGSGALVLLGDDGRIERFHGGEVSLRPSADV
jgi:BirA family transcriptional regulator, biotin operon repressor / biotin---[acetyl-CoA-carboxylase] ligase